MQPCAVWSEDPHGASSPSLLVAITDLETGRNIAEMLHGGSWERTAFQEYTAFERPREEEAPGGELQLLVAQRFLIDVEGKNVEMEQLRIALEELGLVRRLETLAAGHTQEPVHGSSP